MSSMLHLSHSWSDTTTVRTEYQGSSSFLIVTFLLRTDGKFALTRFCELFGQSENSFEDKVKVNQLLTMGQVRDTCFEVND